MARILLLSSRQVLSGEIIKDMLEKGGADLKKIDIVTSSGNLKKGDLGSELYVAAFAFAEHQDTHSHAFLTDVQRSLAPGGVVTIVEKEHKDTTALEKKLVMAGFMECKTAVSPSGDAMIEAKKPSWSKNASKSTRLTAPGKDIAKKSDALTSSKTSSQDPLSSATPKPATSNAWNIAADDDDELVDEDDLLLDADKERPAGYDCGVGTTKKACKDCTCGRAEGQKVEIKLTQEMLDNPKAGGCASCGLGDAFRCGTCPYRGLPSFEYGKKIEVPADFLTADV